jgi:hypothetical protein
MPKPNVVFVAIAGIFLCCAGSAIAAEGPRPPEIANRAVRLPLEQAMRAAGRFQFPAALSLAQQAKTAEGVTPAEVAYIDRLIREWTEVSKNPEAIDEEIAGQLREGRRSIGLLQNCTDIAIVLTQAGKIATCPDALGTR